MEEQNAPMSTNTPPAPSKGHNLQQIICLVIGFPMYQIGIWGFMVFYAIGFDSLPTNLKSALLLLPFAMIPILFGLLLMYFAITPTTSQRTSLSVIRVLTALNTAPILLALYAAINKLSVQSSSQYVSTQAEWYGPVVLIIVSICLLMIFFLFNRKQAILNRTPA